MKESRISQLKNGRGIFFIVSLAGIQFVTINHYTVISPVRAILNVRPIWFPLNGCEARSILPELIDNIGAKIWWKMLLLLMYVHGSNND